MTPRGTPRRVLINRRQSLADVRFAPKADKQQIVSAGPLSAKSGLIHRSIQPTASGLYSISSSTLASWGRQFETVPTPNVPGGRYPDRPGRDEPRRLPESGNSRFKPLLLILGGPGSRASRNGRACPVRNHTSAKESFGHDEYEHSLPRM
jgi:hypothetical protein